jgi:N-acetyl-anhydromuramyl-L-alanine amidase AmpD
MNLKQYPFNDYVNESTPKKQIYLHHTAGTGTPQSVFNMWQNNPVRVATCVVIGRDGEIGQGFSSSKWAYHLGLKQDVFSAHKVPYQSLDKISIGIEIINWGQLTEKDGKFFSYTGREVKDVIEVKYKKYQYWENYTDAQIESTRELLVLWKDKYQIPLSYNEDIWDITDRALKGEAGVFTHNSVRKDKVDVYPHPKLIEMLKSL